MLDEVDAPLDDANVARFTRLIEQLAKDVQFVFISHNKLAMQIADELKGVTMPTAGGVQAGQCGYGGGGILFGISDFHLSNTQKVKPCHGFF